ncbi:hypothetical protein NIES2109_22730 [Nostoc sp. HK-01]|nr:hypothetical protein NIES2109_22730 [Nostoc sp. HK-01]
MTSIAQTNASTQINPELSAKLQSQLEALLNKLCELRWICDSAMLGWDINKDSEYFMERVRNIQPLTYINMGRQGLTDPTCIYVGSLVTRVLTLKGMIGFDEKFSLGCLQDSVPQYLETINKISAEACELLESLQNPPAPAPATDEPETVVEQPQPYVEPVKPARRGLSDRVIETIRQMEALANATPEQWERLERLVRTYKVYANALEGVQRFHEKHPSSELEEFFSKRPAQSQEPTETVEDIDDVSDHAVGAAPAADLSNLYIMKLRKRSTKGEEKQRSYLGTAYMASSYVCTKSVAIFINSLLEELRVNHDTLRFYLHMLNASTVHTYHHENYFVPVCRDFIADKCPGAKEGKKSLIAAGLLECQEDYIPGEKSKRYRVPFEIQERIIDLTINDLLSEDIELQSDRYDLMKQRRAKDAPRSQYTLDGQKITDSHHGHIEFNSNTTNVFPKVLLCKQLKAYRAKYKDMPENTLEERIAKLRAREWFVSAFSAYKAGTLDAGAISLPNGMAMIKPAYAPQKSGRITMYRGGFQNLPRELQDVAFYWTEYRNFDMVAAQSKIAYQLLKEDGLESAWLKNYIDDPNAKKVHAAACFPDADTDARVKTFKDCLHAYLMGAAVTAPSDKLRIEWETAWKVKFIDRKPVRPSALRDIVFGLYNTCSGAWEAFVRWYNHCIPLIKDISAWHKHINLAVAGKVNAPTWLVRNSVQKSQLDKNLGKPSCRNKMGNTDPIDGLKGGNLIREVVPFLLQGAEARFITEAEVISEEYGISISLNMHDGFIALVDDDTNLEGKLLEISSKASERSGVVGCLAEKPFKEPKLLFETDPYI